MATAPATGVDDRAYWLSVLGRVARPVLTALFEHRLKRDMPVEQQKGVDDRAAATHLEAVGRLLCGIAPWLACEGLAGREEELRSEFAKMARYGVASIVDADSPDRCNFTVGGQPLVDAAFLCHALLRAPKVLWDPLEPRAKENVVRAVTSTRAIRPPPSNWLLFSATVEAFLFRAGAAWDNVRVDYAVRQHLAWYKGDGAYGDGPHFHWDYYNSFVIQPMLVDVIDAFHGAPVNWDFCRADVLKRAARYAAVLERLISPEGAIPPIGRSLAYRMGALQHLGQMALQKRLPPEVTPAQVRCAMTAVTRRLMEAPGTFDEAGWLRIGFHGHQPGLGERYISTGSLYLCAAGLLPLGLGPADPFWSDPPARWTSARIYAGEDAPADHAV